MIKIDNEYCIVAAIIFHTPCMGYIWNASSIKKLMLRGYDSLVKEGGYLDCNQCHKVTPLEVVNKIAFIYG